MESCFRFFKQPEKIFDKRLNTYTFSSMLFTFLLSALVLTAFIFFKLGLLEVKDIFFADGAVSDNMQLT